MLIGILSDTHGQHRIAAEALRFFDTRGVEYVIHCGDVGGSAVLDHLVGRQCSFVWGNMDAWRPGLRGYLETVGLPAPPKPPLRLELDGKVFLVFHGHEAGFREALRAGEADYVLHGHTHAARDERVGRVRVINPGALHRARPKTVATLDITADAVTFYAADEKSGTFVPWTPPH
ncbi:MAG: YfcE family phosphodiesterase [Planctomycetota bacterium]